MTHRLHKYLIIFSALFLLGACESVVPNALKPMPWIFDMVPEKGSPIYKKAWKEGCESGLASMTNDFYKTFYTFKQTPELITDEVYYKTWKDVFTFCRHYAYGVLRESDQRMKLPGERGHFDPQGIGNTIEHGGSTAPRGLFGKPSAADGLVPEAGDGFFGSGDELFENKGMDTFFGW